MTTKSPPATRNDGDATVPPTWRAPDGTPVACLEKIKVLNENILEIRQMCQDALEDAVLMGCDEDANSRRTAAAGALARRAVQRLRCAAVFFVLLIAALPARAQRDPFADRWVDVGFARLEALDKVTGRVSVVEIPLAMPLRFGSLDINVRACHRRPPELPPEAAAFPGNRRATASGCTGHAPVQRLDVCFEPRIVVARTPGL